MVKYNGHKNYNHWNVSLWINNDEGLYRLAKQCIREAKHTSWVRHGCCKPRVAAARLMLAKLQAQGLYKTPDGVPYTQTNIIAAMVGME